jgi:HSP20 family protein
MPLPTRRSQDVRTQPLERWEPFRELEQLHDQMGRLMEGLPAPFGMTNGGTWVPFVDIEETEDAWIVEAELPGVDRKDVNVELRDSELVITGEIKEKERKGILRRRTRRTGRFEYRVILPGQTSDEKIDANLHDGVLTVRVPKPEQSRPRRIEVKAS